MAPSFTDASGKVRDLPIAEKDLIVRDKAIGIDRQILKGQPVPGDLLEEYQEAVSGVSAVADEVEDDEFSPLTLNELKAYAAEHGIELGDAKKKDDVLVVVREHAARTES